MNVKMIRMLALMMVSGVSMTAHASPLLVSPDDHDRYQAGTYCMRESDVVRNMLSSLPKGTAHKQFVLDALCIKERIKPYLSATDTTIRYHAYRANAWVIYALHEDNENSLNGERDRAIEQTIYLLSLLDNAHLQVPDETTDKAKALLSETAIVSQNEQHPDFLDYRPDLWQKIATIKKHPRFDDVAHLIAESEIKLFWASQEYRTRGWRHANEHVKAVERYLDRADTVTK